MSEQVGAPAERDEAASDEPLPVVGIGASAGGLESLQEFFSNVSPSPGLAFVVVQHLSPDFRSMMDELLARHTDLAIEVAEHQMPIERDHVYLIPPKKEMTISEGRLLLSDKENALTLPIDLFFHSLAKERGKRATAIVLSGSGSDGSRGVLDIKRAGGRVLVESPDSAKFDGMPLSALATHVADLSGSPAELARALFSETNEDDGEAVPEDDSPMEAIYKMLRQQYGIDFAYYKRSTVSRRIMRRLSMRDGVDLEDYVERLREEPEELAAVYHDLLIGVTNFFRDPEAFALLDRQVIPSILSEVPAEEEVRVWVAGCATGEEAYSIAILLHEHLTAAERPLNYKILATDVHRTSLERCSHGFYSEEKLEHVSSQRLERFFSRRPDGYQVSQDLRQRIVFAPHNVTRDAPFTRMHLITCRNLLIYLEPETQKTVLSLFHFGLQKGGVLFLGSSETPGHYQREFEPLSEQWKLYRKRRDVRLIDPLRLPVAGDVAGSAKSTVQPAVGEPRDGQLLSIYDRLLDRFMHSALLVDEERTLVDTFGGAEQLLRLRRRRPSNNVLDLLRGDLRTVVGGVIQQVLASEEPVRYSGVPLDEETDTPQRATVAAEVVRSRDGARYVLVSIDQHTPPATPAEREVAHVARQEASEASEERVNVLEAELGYTRETLQSAVEAQQTSNEELQATNEELVASNEELQSTNEELHSVNEELYTVNAEYQKKIIELRDLNNDMQNLLEGTDVAILFLDADLCIRKFTPRMASIFHLRPEDIGRPLRDFSHELERPQLHADLQRALEEDVVFEDEVQDSADTSYFLRILPYRPPPPVKGHEERGSAASLAQLSEHDSEPAEETPPRGGVMLSLTDISNLENARARIHQLSAIVESSDDAITGTNLEGTIIAWNRGAERLYGYSADEVMGKSVEILLPEEHQGQYSDFLQTVREGGRVENVETVRRRKDGVVLDVSVTISPILDRRGEVLGLSAIARDISPLKRAHTELEAREAHIRLLLESTAEAIYGLGPEGLCTFCNPACVRMLGYESADQLIGRRMHDLIHHSRADGQRYPESECPIYQVLQHGGGEGVHSDREVLFRADGSSFPAEYWSYPVRQAGQIQGAVVTFLDITDRKRADSEARLAAQRREHFLAMLSHELRNPLAAVLSAVEVLRPAATNGDADAADSQYRALEVISRQSGHMARLLDDLLDVSRITRGGIELRKLDLDLREPIRQAIEGTHPNLVSAQIELDVDLPDEPIPVRGDATRLQQVVGNLLSNTARYSPPGSTAKLSARTVDGHAVVSVQDNGRGIDPSLLPEIFDLFVQTDQGLDRSQGGLGVGLALVKQLVQLHGGEVSAHSEGRGRGSEFRVRLPLQEHAVLHGADGEPNRRGKGGSGRVVLVEDQDDAREMMKMRLQKRGYMVFEASDGEEAVELIEEVHPDLALVDIGLPRLDGYSVAKRLRANPVLGDIVLVALTGYGTRDDVRAAKEAGFDEHLTKPANPDRIREILQERS